MQKIILVLCLLFSYNLRAQLEEENKELMTEYGSRTAKQTWWFFNQRLKEPLDYSFQHVYIEFLNVYVKDIKQLPSGKYKGVVNLNLPHDPAYSESNQEVTFDSLEIDDWFMVSDGYLVGGFLVRIMPFKEQQNLKKNGHFIISIYAINDDFRETSDLYPEKVSQTIELASYDHIFKGGTKAFFDSLQTKIHYPDYAQLMGLEGTVTAVFTVHKTGKVTSIKVLRGIGGGTNDMARIILNDLSQHFNPFDPQLTNAESLSFILPIKFRFRSY